ncbi:NADH-quinone oxidoreductase subunit NuoB [Pseudomonadota bacterium]
MSKLSFASPLNQDSLLDKKIKNIDKKKFKRNKIHVLFYGFSCCNNELGDLFSTEYDIEKYGFYITEKPEQADVLVFSGVYKNRFQINFLKDIYNKMNEPKFVVSVGSCTNGDGIYSSEKTGKISSSSNHKDVELIKADIYVPGCPPTAEAILYGMLKLKGYYS